jgi:hypothetical protein
MGARNAPSKDNGRALSYNAHFTTFTNSAGKGFHESQTAVVGTKQSKESQGNANAKEPEEMFCKMGKYMDRSNAAVTWSS